MKTLIEYGIYLLFGLTFISVVLYAIEVVKSRRNYNKAKKRFYND